VWANQVSFIDIVIRQAHPGPDAPPYETFAEKMRDAQRYKEEERIPWIVLVDDLDGKVHQAYGGLGDPSYLIDTAGRVAFYNMWTHAPTLHKAIATLIGQGGEGVVDGGIDRLPHLLASMTDGWRALRRGLPQSFVDLEMAAPGVASSTWLGYQLRPLAAPLTLRCEPLPVSARIGLAAGVLGLLLFGARRLARND
jgi:hypothetical protein